MENGNSDSDCVIAAALTVIIASTVAIVARNRRRRGIRRRQPIPRTVWVSPLLQGRDQRGAWNSVIPDLNYSRISRNRGTFRNFFRMNEDLFQMLLEKVGPTIARQNTHMRRAVTPEQRLAVTLRYLATGCTYTDLHYSF